ncbi:MAG: cation diffusion facilitator family transporter [Deltaproteobacteria bacterium]|nr:cation diffusion facilitator family transporter [Deltaproteobacteria bacterium]
MKYRCYIIEDEISGNKRGQKRIFWTIILTISICFIEFIGGIIAKSNALIADAGHMLTDSATLFICYFAFLISGQKADSNKTYGYFRAEILASLINSGFLILLSLYIIYSAIKRYNDPVQIDGVMMFVISSVGLIANIIGLLLLRNYISNLNVRAALFHIVGDTIFSFGVVIGAILIIFTGIMFIDSILSVVIGGVILFNAIKLVKSATDILMESVPSDLKINEIILDIKTNIEGIKDIHDVHIWSISSGIYIFTAHIVTDRSLLAESDKIISNVSLLLKEKYNIKHTTIQVETESLLSCR